MRTPTAIFGLIVIALGVVAFAALFTVDQREQVIVLQLGDPKRVIREPGLNVKIPFVQNVVSFDKRILDMDPPAEQVLLSDQKRINVDAFARYRIIDPLRFYQSANNETRLRDRLGATLNSSVRNVVGLHPLTDLLSPERDNIMRRIHVEVNTVAEDQFGIEIVDVRIGRTDLPEEIANNVFDRMRSEREREANLLRAEGDEIKQRITATADKKKTVILADANQKSEVLRGDGEAAQTRILGEAHNTGFEFYSFLRSLESYRKSMGPDDTTLVLSPDSDFFRFFGDIAGEQSTGQ
ncbi:MAG: protease modulator HflC [Rhodospirillales bacterium]|jgi:membrane protease subunit HflC|nr:protease modulator HflC [Rhodospirillales bacterium]MDP6804577.1 protease modulator HflC [Rhodospirillales bacterium]